MSSPNRRAVGDDVKQENRTMMKKYILSMLCLLFAAGIRAQGNLELGEQYYKWQDYKRALPYLQAAAKEGYGQACYLLGEMYYYGWGTEKNYTIAARMYGRATEFGYDQGEAELGRMYENGKGFQKDPQKAFSLYTKSYQRGNLLGTFLLARCYFHGIGTEEDFGKAVFMFDSLYNNAELRDRYEWIYCGTCYYLGHCYKNGWGTSADLEKAVKRFAQSENGDCLYIAAQLVREHKLHDWKVENLLRDACNKGVKEPSAYYEYGKILIDKSYFSSAIGYLEKGAEMGHCGAMQLLGDCYQEGKGVSVNLMKAREWHAKARANGIEIEEKRPQQQQPPQEKAPGVYAVGDVFLSPESKVAVGVVVSVDASGRHGLALSFNDNTCDWETASGKCAGGWRLPTCSELRRIQSFKDLLNKADGCERIFSQLYWSSETQGAQARAVSMVNGKETEWPKTTPNSVRYVMEF